MRKFLVQAMLGASTLVLIGQPLPARAQKLSVPAFERAKAAFNKAAAEARLDLGAGDCKAYEDNRDWLDGAATQMGVYALGAHAAEDPMYGAILDESKRENEVLRGLPVHCDREPIESVLPDLTNRNAAVDVAAGAGQVTTDERIAFIAKAAADCDREIYDRERRKLQDEANKLRDALVKSGVEDPYTDPRLAKLQAALSKYPPYLKCEKKAHGLDPHHTTFRLLPGYRTDYLPRRGFLAHEGYGASEPKLNLWRPHGTTAGAEFEALVEFWLCENFFGGMSFGWNHASDREHAAMIDPVDTLGIPGVNGGASGFALGYNPYNIVYDAHYSRSQTHFNGAVYGGGFYYIPGMQLDLRTRAYFRYDSGAYHEAFGGSIPGYGRDFEYDTRIDTDRSTVGFQADGRRYFGQSDMGAFYAGAGAGLDLTYTKASGWDSLAFTGYADSMRKISADDFGVGFNANARAGYRFESGWDMSAGVTYGRDPGSPYVSRDGTNPSKLELGAADHVIWTMGLSKSF